MNDSSQIQFTEDELLASHLPADPLVAGGVLCHGGFDENGQYISPRTLHRGPAIAAWQKRLAEQDAWLIDLPAAITPPQYPNVAQAKLLLQENIREPIVRALTIISIMAGFGASTRDVNVPDLPSLIDEPIDGTALSHLKSGLFEAHARDEAGHKNEGGHKQMWEAARDLALETPKIPGDILMRLMARRNERRGKAERLIPEISEDLERMVATMANVMVIEIFATDTFDWGERLLGDPEVSADPVAAAAMVNHIRSDETPHVEYLRTALSEIRCRTILAEDGTRVPGQRLVDAALHGTLSQLTRQRPREQQKEAREGLEKAVAHASNPKRVMEEFESLSSNWSPPNLTGFEPATKATGTA
ncbi:hypothetical protein MK489_08075 [Myxococcota bacterium]|nr:hypothetical protein [Myxococcota bacterium]